MLAALLAAAIAAASAPPNPQVIEPAADWDAPTQSAARTACAALLHDLPIDWQPQPAIGSATTCGAPAPIMVTRIAGVDLKPTATLTCPMARALHDWITTSVQPAAADLNSRVTALHTASSYACRTRNHVAGAKISEHARANALDIAAFAFALTPAEPIPATLTQFLGDDGLPATGSFAAHVRDGACRIFTTVLGPGSDAAHGEHFHLDMLVRRNGYRICQ